MPHIFQCERGAVCEWYLQVNMLGVHPIFVCKCQ